MKKNHLLGLVILLACFSCTSRKEFSSISQYANWLNDPSHGALVEREVNDLKLTVKYLPPEYLAAKDSRGLSQSGKDSLLKSYSQSKTFLLTISPNGKAEKQGDLMFRNINNYQQYKERSFAMNFEIGEYVNLDAGDNTYAPVLSTLENTYGLEEGRSIYLVFNDHHQGEEFDKAKELDVVFNDELFNTGLHHFVFSRKNLNDIPHLIF